LDQLRYSMRRFAPRPPRSIAFSVPGSGMFTGLLALTLSSCDLASNLDTAADVERVATADELPPPPTGTVYAVDISYATGEIDADDVTCWKREYKAEHIIVGFNWQQPYLELALRQLDSVVQSGVTVDAYVWVAWTEYNHPLGPERVKRVRSLVANYPVRRLWLDVEPSPAEAADNLGPDERRSILRAAVDACGDCPCGIYTRKNWWNLEIVTTEFSHLPLWYAHYDHRPDFQDWYDEPAANPDAGPFGGWSNPTGKQFDRPQSAPELAKVCGSNIDWDIIEPPDPDRDDDDGKVPPAPRGLNPDGVTVTETPVTLRWDAIAEATYELDVDYLDNGSWRDYWIETTSTNSFAIGLGSETTYRWKVAARNTHGLGPYADWVSFAFDDPSVGTPPPAPTGLRPDGVTVTESSVTLRWDAIADAAAYEVDVDYLDNGSWRDYWIEMTTTNSFELPLGPNTTYRWKVLARNAYGPGSFSSWASFDRAEPVPPPPPPTNLQPNTVNITTSPVTLSVNAILGAVEYEFRIDYRKNDAWVYYYMYSSNTNTKKFWPQIAGTSYRWLARARNESGWGPWSYDAVFWFNP
ncbi:MAG: hypothetical protein O7I93_16495, partial [Gemmatimonadetes bacterium]|nr:hypothetical protein [Gemmatimonadota bacterium]